MAWLTLILALRYLLTWNVNISLIFAHHSETLRLPQFSHKHYSFVRFGFRLISSTVLHSHMLTYNFLLPSSVEFDWHISISPSFSCPPPLLLKCMFLSDFNSFMPSPPPHQGQASTVFQCQNHQLPPSVAGESMGDSSDCCCQSGQMPFNQTSYLRNICVPVKSALTSL